MVDLSTYLKFMKVRRNFYAQKIENPASETNKEFNRQEISARINPEEKVAIAVGSRGITNLDTVVKLVVQKVKDSGADPVLFHIIFVL
jgi:hypothetical protein